jgi:hypothetical protein
LQSIEILVIFRPRSRQTWSWAQHFLPGQGTRQTQERLDDEIIHINRFCWSPNGKWFVAASRGSIRAYKVDDEAIRILPTPDCKPDIGPDAKRLAWNGTDWSLNVGVLNFDSRQNSLTGTGY